MEQAQFTINKTSVELYKIRHSSGLYWADITVDAGEKSGRIQIASDFGDWQNYWGACGCSFKEFLSKLNIHYAADKFDADRYFDQEKTVSSFKRAILEARRSDDITEQHARQLYDECRELEGCSHEQEFIAEMWHLDELMRFFDNGPSICRTITPGFQQFWEMVWPVFIQQLKQEADYCSDCNLPYSSDYSEIAPFPRPNDADIASPIYNALFDVVRTWKAIRIPSVYSGTFDGNGKHAKMLFDSIFPLCVSLLPAGRDRGRMLTRIMPYTAIVPDSAPGGPIPGSLQP